MKHSNRIPITAVLVATLTLLAGCAARRSVYDSPQPESVTWGATAISRAVPFDPAAAPQPRPPVTPTAELPARMLGPAAPSEVGPVTASTGETGVQGISPYVAATPNEAAAAEIGQLPGQAPRLGSALSGNAATPGLVTTSSPGVMAIQTVTGPADTSAVTGGALAGPTTVVSLSPAVQLGARSVDATAARAGSVAVTRTAEGGVVISNLRQ